MTSKPAPSTDEAAVRDLYDQMMEGWNAGSGAHIAARFAEDGDLVGFDGTHLHGRRAIERFHQELFDKWLKGTRLTGGVHDVRFVGPDTAILHAVGGTIARGKSRPTRARDSIQTLVVVRTPEGWRIAAFQNTRLHPMGSGFLAFLHWTIGDALWGLFRLNTEPTGSFRGGLAELASPARDAGAPRDAK